MKAVAYLRTSSGTNVGTDKDSDKRQREAIEVYARANDITVVPVVDTKEIFYACARQFEIGEGDLSDGEKEVMRYTIKYINDCYGIVPKGDE